MKRWFVIGYLFVLPCVIHATVTAHAAKTDVLRHPDHQGYRYSGFIDARVIKPNKAQYILGVEFKSGYSKPIDYILRPYNGKASIESYEPMYQLNNGEDKRAFKLTHKYYLSIRIREDNHQTFRAFIELFARREDSTFDINKPYRFKQADFKLISKQPIQGKFGIDNEYLFVDRADLKFYLKLNFDILFTKEEIVNRFKQGKHQVNFQR